MYVTTNKGLFFFIKIDITLFPLLSSLMSAYLCFLHTLVVYIVSNIDPEQTALLGGSGLILFASMVKKSGAHLNLCSRLKSR